MGVDICQNYLVGHVVVARRAGSKKSSKINPLFLKGSEILGVNDYRILVVEIIAVSKKTTLEDLFSGLFPWSSTWQHKASSWAEYYTIYTPYFDM